VLYILQQYGKINEFLKIQNRRIPENLEEFNNTIIIVEYGRREKTTSEKFLKSKNSKNSKKSYDSRVLKSRKARKEYDFPIWILFDMLLGQLLGMGTFTQYIVFISNINFMYFYL